MELDKKYYSKSAFNRDDFFYLLISNNIVFFLYLSLTKMYIQRSIRVEYA